MSAGLGAFSCGDKFEACVGAECDGAQPSGGSAGVGGSAGASGSGVSGTGGDSGSAGAGGTPVDPCEGAEDGLHCGDDKVCVKQVCADSVCGDGVTDSRTETCDDEKNGDDLDGCTDACALGCEKSDDCDDGDACNGQETCNMATHVCAIGETSLEDATACGLEDDFICVEKVCTQSECGDEFIDPRTETCDDGKTGGDTDGCTDLCQLTCTGNVDCDDGNACNGVESCDLDAHQCVNGVSQVDGVTCGIEDGYICLRASCVESECGDLFTDVAGGEKCDDGQGDETDGCKNDCKFTCETDGDCAQDSGCKSCDAAHMCKAVTVVPAPSALQQCSVFEDYGVFVRPDAQGSDDNDGSRASPFKTLAKALAAAQSQSFIGTPRIYACADVGAYPDTLTLNGVSMAVDFYGNINCGSGAWGYSPNARAHVAPQTASAHALRIKDSSGSITFEGFHFETPDAATAGDSSIAGFISNSGSVSLVRVDLTAGQGKAGADGAQRTSNHASGDLRGSAGGVGTTASGGAAKGCGCVDGTSTLGGRGGSLAFGAEAPSSGEPGSDDNPNAGENAGVSCKSGGTGEGGAIGGSGANASKVGTLTASGWSPGSGTAGSNGAPGQGGGGGGAQNIAVVNYGGGGGGCGGCGGAGADAGLGGGASIALASYESGVTLDATCSLTARSAGQGGDGARGQGKQARGSGGEGAGAGLACSGGDGGNGGDGGHGGAGAGGSSVGVAYVGTPPTGADQASIQVAAAGAAGTNVGAGGGNPPPGVSQKIWNVP